jgi:uncharacterized RDD family membrane protein YckC
MQVASQIRPRPAVTQFTYAGFGVRVIAFALDYVIIAVYLFLLAAAAFALNTVSPSTLPDLFSSQFSAHLSAFILVTLPVTLYFAILQSSSWRATWGKRVMHLNVLRTDGARLSFPRALLRTALQFIPWELSHTLIWQLRFDPNSSSLWLTLGFILVWVILIANLLSLIFTDKHQTLYDLLAGTIVVKSPP